MRLDFHLEVHVHAAGGAGRHAEPLSFFDAGRHFHVDVLAADRNGDAPAGGRHHERHAEFGFYFLLRLGAGLLFLSLPATAKHAAKVEPTRSAARPAEQIAKHLLRRLRVYVSARKAARPTARKAAGPARLPGHVEHLLLLRVGEHVVGVVHFLKLCFRGFVAGVAVRVEPLRELAVRLGDLFG